mmetsp:Transcript_17865/g.41718  ORF Transcript_17865/g.41718 Transcript_17865/m.41718 type:complete len:250 (+) Transcript_17865:485-1234(+)
MTLPLSFGIHRGATTSLIYAVKKIVQVFTSNGHISEGFLRCDPPPFVDSLIEPILFSFELILADLARIVSHKIVEVCDRHAIADYPYTLEDSVEVIPEPLYALLILDPPHLLNSSVIICLLAYLVSLLLARLCVVRSNYEGVPHSQSGARGLASVVPRRAPSGLDIVLYHLTLGRHGDRDSMNQLRDRRVILGAPGTLVVQVDRVTCGRHLPKKFCVLAYEWVTGNRFEVGIGRQILQEFADVYFDLLF